MAAWHGTVRTRRRPRRLWALGLVFLPCCLAAASPSAWSSGLCRATGLAGCSLRGPLPEPWPRAAGGARPLPGTVQLATRGEEAARFAATAQLLRKPKRQVEKEDLHLRFSRSSGPGGQNVNKVETKVDVRFDVHTASFLPEWVKQKLLEKQASRVNSQGMLAFSVQEQRTQLDNIRLAVRKLQAWIDEAAYIPPPPDKAKQAKIRRTRRAASLKRVEDKRRKSERKKMKTSWRQQQDY
mmetsp:Transcript_36910/g.114885  ORF Transcript_36910/g.114885 Transcript_36910/m.114885 type:complete len:239 (-) Transcript_36910:48-764(-)